MRADDRKPSESYVAPPRFCPRCRSGRSPGCLLCPECGETLADRGYCTTCESYWTLPVGADCPKHEVALEAGPPEGPKWSQQGVGPGLVTVGTFAESARAEVLRIRLEAEGIPTFLQGERMGGASMYQVATGGVRLQVPQSFAADARIVLAQSWTPPIEDDDLDDAWDDLGPEPGATRRSVMRALIPLMLLTPAILALLSLLLGR